MRIAGRLLSILAAIFVLAAAPARAQSYLDELIAEARAQQLAGERQWLTLGHYGPGWLGLGYVSAVDSPDFFLVDDGKTDPEAELEATLASFFKPAGYVDIQEQHPQCSFVARYAWLKARLGFDSARLPEQPCLAFDEWYETIDPAQVTLIFPAAYLNQPSSMFGHTLLRIDRRNQGARARLNSYAVNYGALVDDDNGVLFAFKGLFGGYPGNFSLMPYYDKVKEYSDLENRDIWEYELNFEPSEIRRLMMHIWELRRHFADYYFIDENCSYQLLSLLEVARPSLDLTGRFGGWAIPADTVRAVVENEGILSRAVYRPSARTGIDHRLAAIDRHERTLAYELALGERQPDDPALTELPPARQAAVLELGYEYLQYRSRAGEEERDPMARRSLALLGARSEIPGEADVPPLPVPATRPEEGHGSARLSIGGGRMDDRNFLEMRLRPAYHDLVDPQGGFVPGSEIDFLDIALRYYEGADNVDFEKATILSIQSITTRSKFFKPLSWRLDVGVERFRRDGPAEGDIAGTAGGGVGLSYELWNNAILSGFVDGRISGTPDLPDKVLVDIGPSIGLLYYPTSWWALNLTGTYGFALDGGRTGDWLDVGLEQSFTLGRSFALRMRGGLKGDADDPFPEYGASLHWYF
jgi:hypothetical protein